jgi:hypothetical protein
MISAGARVGSAGGTPAFQHRIEEARRLANRKRDGRKRRRACDPLAGQMADRPSEPLPAATE